MARKKFSLAYKDPAMVALMEASDHKTLAIWAIDCVRRVMHYFDELYPDDRRPGQALETLQAWIASGEFKMAVIRQASLASHAAAREVGEDNAARSAARAAGQAVATAHVSGHALAAANYAAQAVHRASEPTDADATVATERAWQIQRLSDLSGK